MVYNTMAYIPAVGARKIAECTHVVGLECYMHDCVMCDCGKEVILWRQLIRYNPTFELTEFILMDEAAQRTIVQHEQRKHWFKEKLKNNFKRIQSSS